MSPWSLEETIYGWLLFGGMIAVGMIVILLLLTFDVGAWWRSQCKRRRQGKL